MVNIKLFVLLFLVILILSGCTSSRNTSESITESDIIESDISESLSASEKAKAISEIKGWINPFKVDIEEWQAFKNPKGDGAVVIGTNSGAWCGRSNCEPEVYLIAYLVNVEKPLFEKVCPLNEISLLSLDPGVTGGQISYCENLNYVDISDFIE